MHLCYKCECSCIRLVDVEARMFKFLDSLFSSVTGIIDIHADHSKCGLPLFNLKSCLALFFTPQQYLGSGIFSDLFFPISFLLIQLSGASPRQKGAVTHDPFFKGLTRVLPSPGPGFLGDSWIHSNSPCSSFLFFCFIAPSLAIHKK